MEWRWEFAWEILPRMLWATGNTLLAAGVGYLIAVVVGLLLMLGQRTPNQIVNIVVREIVEFVRSTTAACATLLCLLCRPAIRHQAVGLDRRHADDWPAHSGPTCRKSIAAHWKVCRNLNGKPVVPSTFQRSTPIAGSSCRRPFRSRCPAWATTWWGYSKTPRLLATIGVAELMHTANALGARTPIDTSSPIRWVGFIFLIISLPTAMGLRRLGKLAVNRAQGK